MGLNSRYRLLAATAVATNRIRSLPACADLFAALDADGIEMLRKAMYFPIEDRRFANRFCAAHSAFTYVGGPTVWVCRDFHQLPDLSAATIVIHEALHHAGLTEWPADPSGMTSREINTAIRNRCKLK